MVKQFSRTVIEVEILSDDLETACFDEIVASLMDQNFPDQSVRVSLIETKEVTGPEMAKLLMGQASDPEFFGLDEDGNEISAEEDYEEIL